jgi:hypothetical protein
MNSCDGKEKIVIRDRSYVFLGFSLFFKNVHIILHLT